VVERIYDFIGWPRDAQAEARMRDWLVEDEKTHQGGHDYSPEQFGLTAEGIRRDFAAYIERHLHAPAAR
jgi:hypothetical protein